MATSFVLYEGGLRTKMQHLQSGISIVTDAPLDNQGKGEAFSPTDLAATSLAGCMLTIMGISGNTHGFSIDGAEARVTKIMGDNPRRIAEIAIELTFPANNYTLKQKHLIEHISKNCPVALSLHPDIRQNIRIIYK
jgi:uncharacterized OsmC-like protein